MKTKLKKESVTRTSAGLEPSGLWRLRRVPALRVEALLEAGARVCGRWLPGIRVLFPPCLQGGSPGPSVCVGIFFPVERWRLHT